MKILKKHKENTVDSIIANTNLKKVYYTDKQCQAIFQVLKPGAHALFYSKTNTQDLMGLMVRLAGFEIRDSIAIVGSKAIFIVARKPLSEATVAANTLKYGTGGLNIDASRITGEAWKRPSQSSVPYEGGWNTIPSESNAAGRFPANIILDEEAAKLLDEQTAGKLSAGHWAKTKVTGYGEFGNGESSYKGVGEKADDAKLGASKFFYVAKDNKALLDYLKTMITPTGGVCLFL